MQKIIFFLIFTTTVFSQNRINNDFFSLNKGGEKHLKPVKYVFFNKKKHNIKESNDKIIFSIDGEIFIHKKNNYNKDVCSLKNLNKIKKANVKFLEEEEYQFREKTLSNDDYWKNYKIKPPMPLTDNHQFFKVILFEVKENKVVKYNVDWTYQGKRKFVR